MILSCQNINKSFVTDDVLKDVSFHLEEREKAALIGPNGAGKSTLLKIIMQEMPADSGEVIVSKGRHSVIWHSIRKSVATIRSTGSCFLSNSIC